MGENNILKISVVILAMNPHGYVKDCIESVFRDSNSLGVESEVLTVKNGSTNDTVKLFEELRKKYLNFGVIRLDKNYSTKLPGCIHYCKFLGGL